MYFEKDSLLSVVSYLTTICEKPFIFKNIVRKGENAGNQNFLLF